MADSVVGNNAFLKVNPADLTAKANLIQGKISAMGDIMDQMVNSLKTVNENWQSTAGDSFMNNALKLITEIKESLENLGFYVKDLNDAAGKYEEIESEINGKVSGLEDPSSIFNV